MNNIFGSCEESLVNNYAKFLPVNSNKNKLLQNKDYRNPSTIPSVMKEGESITYNYYGGIQEKININNNLNQNSSNKEKNNMSK